MPAIMHCPLCDRKVRVPDDLYGKKVKCPGCLKTFEANTGPAPTSRPEKPFPKLSLDEQEASPDASERVQQSPMLPVASSPVSRSAPTQADRDLEPCPYCGENVPLDALRCRFCGEDLDEEEDDRPWERPGALFRRDCEPHRGTMVMTLGIISLACLPFIVCCGGALACIAGLSLGIPAWVLGHIDLKKIDAKTMDPRGRSSTKAGWICGIIGTVLHAVLLVLYVGFLGFMLVGAARPTPVPSVSPAPVPPPKMFLERAGPFCLPLATPAFD